MQDKIHVFNYYCLYYLQFWYPINYQQATSNYWCISSPSISTLDILTGLFIYVNKKFLFLKWYSDDNQGCYFFLVRKPLGTQ